MGIDAHKRRLFVTVLDDDREVLHRGQYDAGYEAVRRLISRLPGCRVQAAYEAGPTGYRLLRWLRDLGCDAFMTPPSLRPKESGDRVKTDTKDSYNLADYCRMGRLKRVWDLTDAQYADRELVRTRQQLVEHRADLYRQIRSKLLMHGLSLPDEVTENWSRTHLSAIEQLEVPHHALAVSLAILVSTVRALSQQILAIERELRALAETERYAHRVGLLRSIPGIGILTAMLVLVEVPDIERFASAAKLAGYLGLVPCEYSSGDSRWLGGLTRTGNRRVRTALIEAAWRVIPKDDRLRDIYQDLKQRRGANKAIVAIARRLSAIMRAMLRDQLPFRATTEQEQAA